MPLDQRQTKPDAFPRSRTARDTLKDALAEAAWAEADLALAQALADFDEIEAAQDEAARAEALESLRQSLARAARKRGLTRIGSLGQREPYDPDLHDLASGRKPKTVRIQARGVARGGDLLVKPRVNLVWRRKKKP